VEIVNFLMDNWEFIFLLVFKYLKDIDDKLDLLHTDNAVKQNEIQNLKNSVTELKGWIKRVEDKVDNHHKGK